MLPGLRSWIVEPLIEPFRSEGRLHAPLAAIFLAACSVACFNAIVHDVRIGYDAGAHLDYVETLSTFRLPGPDETYEYFSPPLPYALPAAMRAAGLSLEAAARAGLLLHVIFYMAIAWSLLALGRAMRPDDPFPRLAAMILLASLPVLYKSFAFLRGEPPLAAFAAFALHRAHLQLSRGRGGAAGAAILGCCLGAAMLSRQWAAFLVAGIVLFGLAARAAGLLTAGSLARTLAIALAACLLVSGWFYASLALRFGSAAAFNRQRSPAGWSLAAQPAEFYFGSGEGKLFSDPVTPAFTNQALPVLYSETWGDYWAYFAIYGRHSGNGRYVDGYSLLEFLEMEPPPEWLETNRARMGRFLGRVNLVSLLPSAAMLCGLLLGAGRCARFLAGRDRSDATAGTVIATIAVATGLAGYFWFLVSFPVPSTGTTLKATYLLAVFPPLALLTGELLGRLPLRGRPWAIAALVACAAHNSPVFISHVNVW